MDCTEITKYILLTLFSMGGTSFIIVSLSKWLGDFLLKRLLDNYKNKHEKELEVLKSKYSKELEKSKNELEKAKSQFLRYSESQFNLYNALWKVLLNTKKEADELWEKANPEKVDSFSKQIKLTKSAINDNLLLIEEYHYKRLMDLIEKFEKFEFGKVKLIDIRRFSNENTESILQSDIKQTIKSNQNIKDMYDVLIDEIGKTFRNQIKG